MLTRLKPKANNEIFHVLVLYTHMIKLKMATSTVYVQFSFLCGLRGYHHYCIIWNPILSETFPARREIGNAHGRYVIAGYKNVWSS